MNKKVLKNEFLKYETRLGLFDYVIKNQVVMAKSKSRKLVINIAIFFMRGDDTVECEEREEAIEKQVITYEDLLQFCEEFMEKNKIRCETEMYTIEHVESNRQIRISPSFEIQTRQLIEKYGVLVIILKSALEQYRKQFQNQILKLKSQVVHLREVIEDLKPVRENLELFKKTSFSNPSLLHSKSVMERDDFETEIDIGIIFSEPLYDEELNKPTLPAVDFRSEISRLYLALESSYKPIINLRCDIATVESLKHFIKYSKPKILHIACHGNSQGNLEFEDDSRAVLGLQHLLKPEKMKFLLKNYTDILPEVVFVNSCHSQKIGRAFFELGVKYVIVINSQDLISDSAAQSFSENFYRNIFKGQCVQEAFSSAKELVQCNHSTGCCCNHTSQEPHRENCRYKKIERTNPKAHKDYHIPSEECKCPMKNFNRHVFTCEWARKVLVEINEDFRVLNQSTNSYEFKKKDLPNYFDRSKKQLVICCCPVKDRKPHSQSHKFKLLIKDEGCVQPIFDITNRLTPEICDYTPQELLESHEKSPNVYGRQKQLFQFLKELREHRLVLVYGKSGTGLTSFTIKAASYMMQRRQAEYFFFMDLYDIKDSIVFSFKFNETTKFDYDYKKGTINQISIKNQKILLLLDNCDDFLYNSPKSFEAELKNLMREIPRAKIILTLKEESIPAFQNQKIICNKFQLQPLDEIFARALLNSKMKDKSHISVGFQEFRSLVRNYEVLRIPKVVESLAQSFSDPVKNKAKFEDIENRIKNINKGNTHQLLKGVLESMRVSNIDAYEFLIFCSQFSEGVFFDDLKIFSSYDKNYDKNSSLKLPIKQNWKEHYLYLFQHQQQKIKKEIDPNQIEMFVPKFENSISEKEKEQTQHSEPFVEIEMKHKFSGITDVESNSDFAPEKNESYFLEKIQKDKFMVKRFIRDFVWNIDKSHTTNMMKFLFIAYFSVVLELLFNSLRKRNFFHEELATYSAISKSGIFSEDTSLENTYQSRVQDMSQSVRLAREIFTDIQSIFIKNEGLQKKLESADPSVFIMNHRHDFLRIYDNNWKEVYDFLLERKQSEEKVFLAMLENIFVYIPTALKIARAENDVILYVLTRSKSQLEKLKNSTKPDRNLILQLKISMIEVSINFHDENNLSSLLQRSDKLIMQYQRLDKFRPERLKHIRVLFEEEKKSVVLLNLLEKNDIDIYEKIKASSEELDRTWEIQPLLQAKKALIIGLMYLKMLKMNRPNLKLYSKTLSFKKLEDSIRDQCLNAASIFTEKDCKKLTLRANLTAIELFWENQEIKLTKNEKKYEDVDKWRQILSDCELMYINRENKLIGFTELDDKIKQLKKKIKDWMWKSSPNSIIFMKAFPIISNNTPIVMNMVRKKTNFRKDIETILNEPVKISPPLARKPSTLKPEKEKEDQKKIQLDISTKFQIFTKKKIIQEAEAGCSIMFISADVKVQNGKCYFVSEGDLMEEHLIEINEEFSKYFNEKLYIIVLCGINTKLALEKIYKFNKRCPIIIALDFIPTEDSEGFQIGRQMDSQLIREMISEQKQIRNAQMAYTKRFVKKIFRAKLNTEQSNKKVKEIHDSSFLRMKEETKCQKIFGFIHIEGCTDIFMEFKEGTYRDLSPGYEGNHNIDDNYFNKRIVIRRWRKMHEVLAYLHRIAPSLPVRQSIADNLEGEDLEAFSQYKPTYINIYGEAGSGKTYFIHEIAKILIEREVYNFGVFLLDGKRIETKHNGDIEDYIRRESKNNKMPVFEDFDRLMGVGMILIIDDFHYIRAKSNAKMKIFTDKVIEKKVNLILVSNTEVKNQHLPKLKKVRLEALDDFETDVFAFSVLDIQNVQQIRDYEKAKGEKERPLKAKQIEEIFKRYRRNYEDKKDIEIKKVHSHAI